MTGNQISTRETEEIDETYNAHFIRSGALPVPEVKWRPTIQVSWKGDGKYLMWKWSGLRNFETQMEAEIEAGHLAKKWIDDGETKISNHIEEAPCWNRTRASTSTARRGLIHPFSRETYPAGSVYKQGRVAWVADHAISRARSGRQVYMCSFILDLARSVRTSNEVRKLKSRVLITTGAERSS